jgi:hypothetical protein
LITNSVLKAVPKGLHNCDVEAGVALTAFGTTQLNGRSFGRQAPLGSLPVFRPLITSEGTKTTFKLSIHPVPL